MAELDDRDTLDDGGQAGRDGADRSGQTSELTQQDPNPERCPATTRYIRSWTHVAVGIQCKHGRGHDGDHAGYAGYGYGDVFWDNGG